MRCVLHMKKSTICCYAASWCFLCCILRSQLLVAILQVVAFSAADEDDNYLLPYCKLMLSLLQTKNATSTCSYSASCCFLCCRRRMQQRVAIVQVCCFLCCILRSQLLVAILQVDTFSAANEEDNNLLLYYKLMLSLLQTKNATTCCNTANWCFMCCILKSQPLVAILQVDVFCVADEGGNNVFLLCKLMFSVLQIKKSSTCCYRYCKLMLYVLHIKRSTSVAYYEVNYLLLYCKLMLSVLQTKVATSTYSYSASCCFLCYRLRSRLLVAIDTASWCSLCCRRRGPLRAAPAGLRGPPQTRPWLLIQRPHEPKFVCIPSECMTSWVKRKQCSYTGNGNLWRPTTVKSTSL